jgi:hypothetical protein
MAGRALALCPAAIPCDDDAGLYTLQVGSLDDPQGVSRLRLVVAGQVVDGWAAAGTFPMRVIKPDGSSSTRRVVPGIELRAGDVIRIGAVTDVPETAALDHVEIVPDRH